jgi:mono/diheme cytochrome c family protein
MRTLLTFMLIFVATRFASGEDASALWVEKVQPLFDVTCVKCHGPLEQKSGLELDTPEAVLRGGDEGEVLVPGKPEESPLYLYLAEDSDPHMPPKKQLGEEEREVVRAWIEAMATPPGKAAGSPAVAVPVAFDSVTEAMDTLISEGWERRDVTPAAPVDERTWCRRVYLDLIGRIPTLAELEAFLFSPETSKRTMLVDQLLHSEAYAVRMRELWDVFLMGRGKRQNHEDRRKDNGWWAFLENAFRENRPWNETVRDFLVARPDSPDSKGASWFLYERRDQHQSIAEAVAPVVYGTRVDCAQCHDHPLAREIKQGHYWGLVAAFNRSKNIKGSTDVSESAVGGFINFTNLEKESQPAVIMLMNGRTVDEARPTGEEQEKDADDKYLDPSANVRVPKFSRREAFADAATHENPLLARAFVNRMWAALLGLGLVHPAIDMTERNVPSHPELLDWLAEDFAAHHYDVRRLVRGIVLSRVYALGSSEAAPDSFAGALERSLSAEQIARSWRVAAGLPPDDDTLRRAIIAAIPEVLPDEYNATFQQAQFLAGSPELAELINPSNETTVARLATLDDIPTRVREAFLAVYARWPDDEELARTGDFLRERSAQRAEAVRDLLWALMTSAEFLTIP